MSPESLDAGEDTREALMGATYRALCAHGYADLTISRIGEEFEKSTSLLYHHYEGKDALLLDFLEHMLASFEEDVPDPGEGDPLDHLDAMLDFGLVEDPEEERREFMSAFLELRAQAAHDEAYRAHFTRHDEVVREKTADLIREGVAEGTFRDVDPAATAALFHALFDGVLLQRTTAADDTVPVAEIREGVDAIVEARLLAE